MQQVRGFLLEKGMCWVYGLGCVKCNIFRTYVRGLGVFVCFLHLCLNVCLRSTVQSKG